MNTIQRNTAFRSIKFDPTTKPTAQHRSPHNKPRSKMSLHLRDPAIAKLARVIMKDGKMHASLRIIDTCFEHLRVAHNIQHPAAFTKRALRNARPVVELRKYKVSGRALQIPVPCRPARQESLAVRFVR